MEEVRRLCRLLADDFQEGIDVHRTDVIILRIHAANEPEQRVCAVDAVFRNIHKAHTGGHFPQISRIIIHKYDGPRRVFRFLGDHPQQFFGFSASLCSIDQLDHSHLPSLHRLLYFALCSERGKVYIYIRRFSHKSFFIFIIGFGAALYTVVYGGTDAVSQTFPPITLPRPIVTSPPRIVAPA